VVFPETGLKANYTLAFSLTQGKIWKPSRDFQNFPQYHPEKKADYPRTTTPEVTLGNQDQIFKCFLNAFLCCLFFVNSSTVKRFLFYINENISNSGIFL
jgi:hypothetical protein